MLKKFLLGITNEGNLVFTNVEYNDDIYEYFSVTFNEVEPFEYNKDIIEDMIEDRINYDYSKEELYDLYEKYDCDCSPSKLLDNILEYNSEEELIDMFYDTSLYSETYRIGDSEIYFESIGGGQHDTRDDLDILPHGQEFTDFIFEIWDNYHLKALDNKKKIEIFNKIDEKLKDFDEELYIQDYLEEVFL